MLSAGGAIQLTNQISSCCLIGETNVHHGDGHKAKHEIQLLICFSYHEVMLNLTKWAFKLKLCLGNHLQGTKAIMALIGGRPIVTLWDRWSLFLIHTVSLCYKHGHKSLKAGWFVCFLFGDGVKYNIATKRSEQVVGWRSIFCDWKILLADVKLGARHLMEGCNGSGATKWMDSNKGLFAVNPDPLDLPSWL